MDTRIPRILTQACLAVAAVCSLAPRPVRADVVPVAVAANFAGPMKEIAAAFAEATGHQAIVSTGATGALAAQVANGAPFEVFLSADATTPAKLEKDGLAVAGTRGAYAVGRLVLWSAKAGYVDTAGAVLKTGDFAHLALANPKLAPYGAAAVAALEGLGLLTTLEPRFVLGENIGQAFQFAGSGNAELGFVALSQVWRDGKFTSGSGWIVPARLHAPLRQDAVLLARGAEHTAAKALLEFLHGEKARAVMRCYGYEPAVEATSALAR